MSDIDSARVDAERFVNSEREFHLGALPTEQAHPKTRGLSERIAVDPHAGIAMLQSVDADVTNAARRVFASPAFGQLVDALTAALDRGARIVFSGCGATGRLSILVEAACRTFRREARLKLRGTPFAAALSTAEDAMGSIMTGGDYALVRSLESFEDYMSFGRRQALDAGIGPGDVLVAITEGGETSSVIGTAWQALESGAHVFFACNNPLDVLGAHVERSRRIIEEPGITKLDLSSGPMAIAGSTRMQATTIELLVIGAALEIALGRSLQVKLPPEAREVLDLQEAPDATAYATRFESLLRDLARPTAVDAMARWGALEETLYQAGDAVTYFGNEFLLDIFTDTTERAPTFSFPPFRKCDDRHSPRPTAFVKNPLYPTPETWVRMLGREPRCLAWDAHVYRALGAPERIVNNPPRLDRDELFKFLVGNEDDPSRRSNPGDCAALVLVGAECMTAIPGSDLADAFRSAANRFPASAVLAVGPGAPLTDTGGALCHIACALPPSPIRLWDHLAAKLVLNTISTATATRLGRVTSNWMAYVETSNKKLIDRGTRLVAELADLDYAHACFELHKTMAQVASSPAPPGGHASPVAQTLARLRGDTSESA